MTSRRRITKALQIRVFDAATGHCHICGQPIRKQPWQVEHVKPLWLGGADDETNMKPAHLRCHQDKTSAEAPVRAKGTRIRARHIGVKPRRPSFQTNRNGPYRKKMDGTIVPR
jgi:5-methylcytosine-specific restriction protein A